MGAVTAALIGGAVLGGIAGAQGRSQTSRSVSSVSTGLESAEEEKYRRGTAEDYKRLQQLVGAREAEGLDAQTQSAEASRSLTDMLAAYARGGFLPSEADIGTSRQFARDIFAGQQTALEQDFEDEQTRMQRLAAQLGRPINDPILQAKFAQEKTRQQQMLEAQKTGFVAQDARNLPLQRLAFQGQLADVQSQLASQALQNRQALLNIGSQLQSQERNWRLGTATRTQVDEQREPGGLAEAITGAIGGASAFGSIAHLGSQAGWFGGGGAPSTGFVTGPAASFQPAGASAIGSASNLMQPRVPTSGFLLGR